MEECCIPSRSCCKIGEIVSKNTAPPPILALNATVRKINIEINTRLLCRENTVITQKGGHISKRVVTFLTFSETVLN